ncbi:hypothetical protein [Streptomyces sp. NPDC097619]|uniref:hypothetical protein n=1 Tax=Streptomyces sp. NPDC097619 TaxID=3157228 RepID=UPI00331E7B45
MTEATPLPLYAPRSVAVAARVTTILARTFPEYVSGEQGGFRVESLDVQEPRRMFVRWYRADGTTDPEASAYPGMRDAVLRAGYAVAELPRPGIGEFFVADRPHDTSGRRYETVPSDIPVAGPAWLVRDRWTRVPVAAVPTEEEAVRTAHRFENAAVLADAHLSGIDRRLVPFLDRADALLGNGVHWWRREVHSGRYQPAVRHDRLDALVDVANALRQGRDVVAERRQLTYRIEVGPLADEVHWIPKSTAPTIGHFPGDGGPLVATVVGLLLAAGLTAVEYGEPIAQGGFWPEVNGFLAGSWTDDNGSSGVTVTPIGRDTDLSGVPDVLRAAGWSVSPWWGDDSWQAVAPQHLP